MNLYIPKEVGFTDAAEIIPIPTVQQQLEQHLEGQVRQWLEEDEENIRPYAIAPPQSVPQQIFKLKVFPRKKKKLTELWNSP